MVLAAADPASSPVGYSEVHKWVSQLAVDPEALRPFRDQEVEDGGCGCMSRRPRSKADVPKLDRKLGKERDLVLFLKMTMFDFNEAVHFRMLRTMYTKLTRNKMCPSIGGHWEVIGFQGGDPRTDVNRANGVLNVLHLFFFFAHYFELMKGAYLLAQDDQQNYPLACISVNITLIVMEAFFQGRLSSLCNKGECSVFETICKVHSGGLFHFYHRWKSLKRTISDTQQTLNEVKALVERNPVKLLGLLKKAVEERKAQNDPGRLEFTELDFGTARGPAKASAKAAPKSQAKDVPKRLRNYNAGAE